MGLSGLSGAIGGGLSAALAPERHAAPLVYPARFVRGPRPRSSMRSRADRACARRLCDPGPDLSVLGRQSPPEIPRPDEKRPEAFMASGLLISRVMPDWHQAISSCCSASRGSQPFEARRRTATTPNTEARPARLAATEVGSGTVMVTSVLFTTLSDAPE